MMGMARRPELMGGMGDPLAAVMHSRLTDQVKDYILQACRKGDCSPDDFSDANLAGLERLFPKDALEAVHQYAGVRKAKLYNPPAFFSGIIKRVQAEAAQARRQASPGRGPQPADPRTVMYSNPEPRAHKQRSSPRRYPRDAEEPLRARSMSEDEPEPQLLLPAREKAELRSTGAAQEREQGGSPPRAQQPPPRRRSPSPIPVQSPPAPVTSPPNGTPRLGILASFKAQVLPPQCSTERAAAAAAAIAANAAAGAVAAAAAKQRAQEAAEMVQDGPPHLAMAHPSGRGHGSDSKPTDSPPQAASLPVSPATQAQLLPAPPPLPPPPPLSAAELALVRRQAGAGMEESARGAGPSSADQRPEPVPAAAAAAPLPAARQAPLFARDLTKVPPEADMPAERYPMGRVAREDRGEGRPTGWGPAGGEPRGAPQDRYPPRSRDRSRERSREREGMRNGRPAYSDRSERGPREERPSREEPRELRAPRGDRDDHLWREERGDRGQRGEERGQRGVRLELEERGRSRDAVRLVREPAGRDGPQSAGRPGSLFDREREVVAVGSRRGREWEMPEPVGPGGTRLSARELALIERDREEQALQRARLERGMGMAGGPEAGMGPRHPPLAMAGGAPWSPGMAWRPGMGPPPSAAMLSPREASWMPAGRPPMYAEPGYRAVAAPDARTSLASYRQGSGWGGGGTLGFNGMDPGRAPMMHAGVRRPSRRSVIKSVATVVSAEPGDDAHAQQHAEQQSEEPDYAEAGRAGRQQGGPGGAAQGDGRGRGKEGSDSESPRREGKAWGRGGGAEARRMEEDESDAGRGGSSSPSGGGGAQDVEPSTVDDLLMNEAEPA
ncbi:hypothetical protein V8C86DRAFT_2563580 [Haematococcus lacustris]